MRYTATLAFTLIALPLAAQTTGSTAHPATATHTAAGAASRAGCVQVPAISPKIPPLGAGMSCPKALFTLTTVPSVHIDYTSPMENPTLLREGLGLASATFSLAYVDTKVGTGPLAAPHKWYSIHYTGYLVDGTKFDSSYDHPDKEPIVIHYGEHQVIPGWDTGIDGMHVGGKRRLFIPWQLAYGPNGRPPTIPGKAELIFDVELVAQSDREPAPKEPEPSAAQPGTGAGRIEVHPEGPQDSGAPKIRVTPIGPPTPVSPSAPATPQQPQ